MIKTCRTLSPLCRKNEATLRFQYLVILAKEQKQTL